MRRQLLLILTLLGLSTQLAFAGNPTIGIDTHPDDGPYLTGTLSWDQQALANLGFMSVNGIDIDYEYWIGGNLHYSSAFTIYPESQSTAYFSASKDEYYSLYFVSLKTNGKEYLYHQPTGSVVSIDISYITPFLTMEDDAILDLEVLSWNSTYEFSIPANLTPGQLQNPENYPELAQWAWLINWLWGD